MDEEGGVQQMYNEGGVQQINQEGGVTFMDIALSKTTQKEKKPSHVFAVVLLVVFFSFPL